MAEDEMANKDISRIQVKSSNGSKKPSVKSSDKSSKIRKREAKSESTSVAALLGSGKADSSLNDLFANAKPKDEVKAVYKSSPSTWATDKTSSSVIKPSRSQHSRPRTKAEKHRVEEDRMRKVIDSAMRDSDNISNTAHESLQKTKQHEKRKTYPIDKTRGERTLFVGNLPKEVITEKAIASSLRELFETYGSVETIRYRSVTFASKLPRPLALARKELHEGRDNVNAYIVMVEKEAAEKARELNGCVFYDKHIRVDDASNKETQNPRMSVFVGNLNFSATEESLWRHFNDCGEIESVRIVRDPNVNIGKGFGYVQFKDRNSVIPALMLNESRLAGDNRPLRVIRCHSTNPDSKRFKNIAKGKNNLSSRSKPGQGRVAKQGGVAKQGKVAKPTARKGTGRIRLDTVIEGHRAKPGEGLGKQKGKAKKRK